MKKTASAAIDMFAVLIARACGGNFGFRGHSGLLEETQTLSIVQFEHTLGHSITGTSTNSQVILAKNLICSSTEYRSSVLHMNEKTIQSIPIMPFALMLACIGAVVGLIIGIFYAAVFGSILATIPTSTTTGVNLGPLRTILGVIFGVGAIIIVPIVGFIGGLIQGLIYAGLYNFLAPRIGGIRLRFKEENQPQQ